MPRIAGVNIPENKRIVISLTYIYGVGNSLSKKTLQLGAKDCKIINVKTIRTAAWVRFKCQYGCSGYGECLTCPPYSPKPEETQDILNCFKN